MLRSWASGEYVTRTAREAIGRPPAADYRGHVRIHIGHELVFDVPRPTPMLLMLYVRPEVATALEQPEGIVADPVGRVESFVDWFGNRAAPRAAP